MKMKGYINKYIDELKTIKTEPLNGTTFLLPLFSMLSSVIAFIIAIVEFVVNKGYANEIERIKEKGIDNIVESFSSGTVNVLFSKPLIIIISILLIADIILILIKFFKTSSKTKRIIMIIDILLCALLVIICLLYGMIENGIIKLNEKQLVWFIVTRRKIGINEGNAIFLIPAIILILFITFAVILLKSDCNRMFKSFCGFALASFALLPLLLYIIENIIVVVICIIIIVVFVGLFFLFIKGLKNSNDPTESDSKQKANKTSNTKSKSNVNKTPKPNNAQKPKTLKLGWDVNVRKVHGFQHDYIESYTSLASGEFCSLSDLREGKCIICDENGKKLTEKDIPWKN